MKKYFIFLCLFCFIAATQVSNAADHTQAKIAMFGFQKQACPAAMSLWIGDSNTEGMWWNYVCGNSSGGWIINGGIGGETVKGYLDALPQIMSQTSPQFVTVAIGTNDAAATLVGTPSDIAWETNYTTLVDTLLAAGKRVALFTIPPVEQNKPLGEGYFLTSQIQRFNSHIRALAASRGLILKDIYMLWANSQGFAAAGSTVDGVHHTRTKQVAYYYQLEDAIRTMRSAVGLSCP